MKKLFTILIILTGICNVSAQWKVSTPRDYDTPQFTPTVSDETESKPLTKTLGTTPFKIKETYPKPYKFKTTSTTFKNSSKMSPAIQQRIRLQTQVSKRNIPKPTNSRLKSHTIPTKR